MSIPVNFLTVSQTTGILCRQTARNSIVHGYANTFTHILQYISVAIFTVLFFPHIEEIISTSGSQSNRASSIRPQRQCCCLMVPLLLLFFHLLLFLLNYSNFFLLKVLKVFYYNYFLIQKSKTHIS